MDNHERSMSRRTGSLRRVTSSFSIPGAAPGTLVANPDSKAPVIHVIAYDRSTYIDKEIKSVDDLKPYLGKSQIVWVNVEGLGSSEVIQQLGDLFGIHQLALEDVLSVHQRAKLEQYGQNLFLVLHMLEIIKDHLEIEQLSIFSGEKFVVTFQEGPIDCLHPVRDRLKKGQGKLRVSGADYLMYSLVDAVIDGYFPVLEDYGERLETLEDCIIQKPDRKIVAQIHGVKRDLLILRRSIWPVREAINTMIRDAQDYFTEETRIHLRDVYDHAVRIIDFIETYRELGADLMDVYLSSTSNRLSESMRVLTILTMLFVPPTFIAGVYGMNFNPEASPLNMPELNWYYGYPFALLLMVIVSAVIFAFLWRRGWLGVSDHDESAHGHDHARTHVHPTSSSHHPHHPHTIPHPKTQPLTDPQSPPGGPQ